VRKRQYKQGTDRQQGFLLPPSIDEYVAEDNPVRAIDSYVESLDLRQLGFQNMAETVRPGQPAYHPSMHLKLYLYGYLNRVRSSRRLAAECRRNLEVIWLLEGQRPSYKVIADFRKDNLAALKAVNRDFVQVCQELALYGAELVGIDGSFLRGNVAKAQIYTAERLQRSLASIDTHIAQYLQEMEQADQQEGDPVQRDPHLHEKLEQLRQRKQQRTEQLAQLAASGEKQIAEVDPDARLLTKRGGTLAGYNVQVAVDSKHKLILVAEAVQDGNDEQQMAPMGSAAKAVLGVDQLTTTQDQGYFNGLQILACEANGITPYVPEPDKQAQTREQGRFPRDAFVYEPEANAYRCPHGQQLQFSTASPKRGKLIFHYRSSVPVCAQCALKEQCLPKKTAYRTVTRWEHEALIEAHRVRMAAQGAEMMRQRAAICEHIFGTLKLWCGWTHFLLRGLAKVRAELSLLMLAYNFKRVLQIFGLAAFRAFCLQRKLEHAAVRG
jgi:transposase